MQAEVQEVQAEQQQVQEAPQKEQKELTFKERVIALQNELKAPKSRYNSFGKYAYRSCEDIVEAVKPLCEKYGLLLKISDSVQLVGSRFYIQACAALLDTRSEETASSIGWAREDEVKKGMDGSQITGTASSYARKYALNGLLLIDDTKDADTDEFAKQTGKAAAKPVDEYYATLSKMRHIADLEIWWNSNLDELKAHPQYKEIYAFASQKGKELNANS